MKAIVVQTFYVPMANRIYKCGPEEIEVDPDFARRYASCLNVTKEAVAPLNKMITTEKEMTKEIKAVKTPVKRGRKKNGV